MRRAILGCTLVAILLLAGCGWELRARYELNELTRVYSIQTGGVRYADQETIRALLLPSVSVPTSKGVGSVQEDKAVKEEQGEVRGDDETPEEGACVDARTPEVYARCTFEPTPVRVNIDGVRLTHLACMRHLRNQCQDARCSIRDTTIRLQTTLVATKLIMPGSVRPD